VYCTVLLPPGFNPIAVNRYIYICLFRRICGIIYTIYKYIYVYIYIHIWLRWSRGSVLAFSTQVCGFKPGRSRRIFRAKKSSARLSSEGISRVVADGGTWQLKWERLKEGESNGKLPPRTYPVCSVPEPYRSHDWGLVRAKPGLQGWILMNEYTYMCICWYKK